MSLDAMRYNADEKAALEEFRNYAIELIMSLLAPKKTNLDPEDFKALTNCRDPDQVEQIVRKIMDGVETDEDGFIAIEEMKNLMRVFAKSLLEQEMNEEEADSMALDAIESMDTSSVEGKVSIDEFLKYALALIE
jgi:Ca2+-binding EF-hand superfamily protein